VEHARRQAQLAAIANEMNAIHTANKLYWNQKENNHKEDMRHQRRQERLEQLRKEIQELIDPEIN
jgi:hypothetical protein